MAKKKGKKPVLEQEGEEIQVSAVYGKRPDFAQDAIDETAVAAAKAKKEAEATRAYVLDNDNYKRLLGCTIPVEILRIQNLPSHECLIIDDHLLLSYVEAKELLEQLEEPT